MNGRLRNCSSYLRQNLGGSWQLRQVCEPPASSDWLPAQVPGTVASSLEALGRWPHHDAARDLDQETWEFRLTFDAADDAAGAIPYLHCDGLATLAEVWLNGDRLATSSNMFRELCVPLSGLRDRGNELLLRFLPLAAAVAQRRGRPRWRTPMVASQQLRYFRTTLLGRTPGWSPAAAAVGPWRPVWVEYRRAVEVDQLHLQSRLLADGRGELTFDAMVRPLGPGEVVAVALRLRGPGADSTHAVQFDPGTGRAQLQLQLPGIRAWWPHTHGEPNLYAVEVEVQLRTAASTPGQPVTLNLGNTGFRSITLDRESGAFALTINGERIFCRGALWMPVDALGLQETAEVEQRLAQVRAAGMNMLRFPGTAVYPSDSLLDLCDAAGILVWQDLMFANMDYPADDAEFLEQTTSEVQAFVQRQQARPSLCVLCGNSEGSQQASMSGAPRELWYPPLFEQTLADIAARYCPDVPYTSSSAWGGAFPHQSSSGSSSYYGVGAYLRPLTDARHADVRFATECLAFANVPEPASLARAGAAEWRVTHPAWKRGVPRDQGAGWDFDDVRDHYFRELLRLDPMHLRYAEHDRYLRLSRLVSAEVMAATLAEWRASDGRCGGALILALNDLAFGAGWGIVDSLGVPKAPYYYLKRVLQPVSLVLQDEGTNGLVLHLFNDTPQARAFTIDVRMYREQAATGGVLSHQGQLAAHSHLKLPMTDMLPGFSDLTYAYRFGALPYDTLVARLSATTDVQPVGESSGVVTMTRPMTTEVFYYPAGMPGAAPRDIGLSAEARRMGDGHIALTVTTTQAAYAVHIDAGDCLADDQYFHLPPNGTRVVQLRSRSALPARLRVTVSAANSTQNVSLVVQS